MIDIPKMREVVSKLTKLLAGKNIRVTQIGTGAYVSVHPKTQKIIAINIPYIPDNATDKFVFAIQGFIDHEIGHVLFTDFDQYQASDARLQGLNNLIEDTMIERHMSRLYPGTGYNLDRLYDYFIKNITQTALDTPDVKGNNALEFDVLLVPLLRGLSGQSVFMDWMKSEGHLSKPLVKALLDRLPKDFETRLRKISKSRESVALAKELFAIIYPPAKKTDQKPTKEQIEEGEKNAKDFQTTEYEEPEKKDKPGSEGEGDDKSASDDEDNLGDDGDDEEDADGDGKLTSEDDGAKSEGDDEAGKDVDADADADDGVGDQEDRGEDEAEQSGGSKSSGDTAGDGDKSDALAEESALSAGGDDKEIEDDHSVQDDTQDDVAGEEGEENQGSETGEEDQPKEVGASTERTDSSASEGEEDEEGGQQGGIGSGGNPFAKANLEAVKSFAEQLSREIGDQAAELVKDAPYVPLTKDHDIIEKVRIPGRFDDRLLTKLEDETRRIAGVMQKDIERLMASRSQVLNVPGFKSGKLHSGSLHRVVQGDDKVFRRRKENKSKDTAVSLVVDQSGSMSGPKVDVAMQAAFALSQTLERCGIMHEVVGFTTGDVHSVAGGWNELSDKMDQEVARHGREVDRFEPIYMPIFKECHERLTPDVKRRFAAGTTEGRGIVRRSNVDGESIEMAVLRLRQRSESRKVMIVLSDGEPATSMRNWLRSQEALHNHLRSVIDRSEKQGVEMIGIGIMSDAVRRFYKKYIILKRVEELPGALMGQLRQVLLN